MRPNDDQLAVLHRLRTEGQISDEEFRDLAGNSAGPEPEPGEVDESSGDGPIDAETGSDDPFLRPRLRQNITPTHVLGLLLAGIILVGLAIFGILSWWIALPAIVVSLTTLIDGWQRVTSIGALLVGAFFLVSVVSAISGPSQPTPAVSVAPIQTSDDPVAPIAGSLGIYMDQVTELWNTVEAPPTINRGLIRQNEIGEYDTFVYRFGDGAQVAGAYGPDNDALYALLVSGPFDYPGTAQLYLHVCYMVAPFSQDCIDSYFEQGLAGGTLDDFTDSVHQAEWVLGEHTWRLEIGQNLLAIRVYGKDAA